MTATPVALEEFPSDRQFAATLARGLAILRCFSPEHPVLGNRELSEKAGLPKPTISRFTYTLLELGYLQTDRATGKYQLGSAVLTLSYPLLANIPLRQVVRGPMRRLADKIGGSVSLGMRDRLNIVYVETSRSKSMRSQQLSDIGMTHPIVASSNGRAFLAASTANVRETLINEIKVKASAEWEKYGDAALQMVEIWKNFGFCYSYGEEYRPDVCTVAVPYRDHSKGELFVFNCVLHPHLVKPGTLETEFGPRLLDMVSELKYF